MWLSKKYISKVKEKTRLLLDARSYGIPCDGNSFFFFDTLFTICPWWDGPTVRSRIEVLLAEDAKKRSKQWFWVHHAPPAGSPTSWDGNSYPGDVELEQWIGQYKPDAVLCVHQSPLRPGGSWVDRIGSTLVFNPGRQYGRPPTHIILDSAHQTGLWFSEAGNQYVRLDQTPIRAEDLTELPEWLRVTRRDHDPSLA